MIEQRPYTFDRVVRILIGLGLVAGLIWLANYLSDVLIPFTVALLLAYLTNPLVALVEKKIPNRPAAVAVSLFGIIALALLLGWIVIPRIAGEIVQMGRMVTELVNNSDLAERASRQLPPDLWQIIKNFLTRPEIKNFFQDIDIWKIGRTVAQKVLPGVWGLITGAASFIFGLVGLFVIGLYFIFLLLDYETVRGWKELVPPAYRDSIVGLVEDFESAMSNYFRGQAAVAFICGVLFAIGFALIGLPLGILLGLFIGLLNMVPYLQLIGLIPAVLLALMHAVETGINVWLILGLTGLVFVVVQIIQDAILVPRIMGKVTGLNPAMIMLSLSIWGKLLGLLGMIIALPVTYLLLVYYRRLILLHKPVIDNSP
ncbi:MAG: AI-2E family transporter [Deltaproteobacteria bacterium]|nr:AI-2E family transporter [Deltaproteobacteria bacterium]